MSASPSVGQWVWGEAKTPCQVIDIGTKRSSGQTILKVAHPQGRSVIIPLDKVRGFGDTPPLWAVPAVLISPEPITETLPKSLAVGDVCELTEADYPDAVGLVEVADNREAIEAVRSALTQVFTHPADKRRLWKMLNPQQREKLSISIN